MTRWRSSVRLRLATLYVAGLSLMLLAFSASVFVIVRVRLRQAGAAQARAELARLERYVQQEGLENPEEMEEPGYEPFLLLGSGGAPLYVSAAWRTLALPESAAALAGSEERTANGTPLRLARLRFACAGSELEAFVALDVTDAQRLLSILLVVLLGGTAVALAGALFLGYWLAGRALAPVAALARAAERVGADQAGARLPVGASQDEFDRLAQAFNAVLERLQSAIEELRRFSSHVSHELRTPLTAMRVVGEQALRRGVDARGEEALGSMLEEVERLTNLIEQLLCLARAEGAEADQRATPVDPAAVAREVAAACGVLAEEREQQLVCELEEGLLASAHPLLLRQALYNLLDNAIRYTPPRGHVRVRARSLSAEELCIEIVDDGPGIAPEHQQRVFERFARMEQDGSAPGAGLGLAIARRAIETCRGRIELSSALGVGSCFRVVLRTLASPAPRVEEPRGASSSSAQGSSPS